MWFYDEWKCKPVAEASRGRVYRWRALVAWNAFIILAGMFICVAGSYGAIVGIKNQCKNRMRPRRAHSRMLTIFS